MRLARRLNSSLKGGFANDGHLGVTFRLHNEIPRELYNKRNKSQKGWHGYGRDTRAGADGWMLRSRDATHATSKEPRPEG
jgi:hypothetical protein